MSAARCFMARNQVRIEQGAVLEPPFAEATSLSPLTPPSCGDKNVAAPKFLTANPSQQRLDSPHVVSYKNEQRVVLVGGTVGCSRAKDFAQRIKQKSRRIASPALLLIPQSERNTYG